MINLEQAPIHLEELKKKPNSSDDHAPAAGFKL